MRLFLFTRLLRTLHIDGSEQTVVAGWLWERAESGNKSLGRGCQSVLQRVVSEGHGQLDLWLSEPTTRTVRDRSAMGAVARSRVSNTRWRG